MILIYWDCKYNTPITQKQVNQTSSLWKKKKCNPYLASFSNNKEIISTIRMTINKIIVHGEVEDVEGLVRVELQDETVLYFFYALHVRFFFETKYGSNWRPNRRRRNVSDFIKTWFIWRSNWLHLTSKFSLFLGWEGWYIKLIFTHFLSSVLLPSSWVLMNQDAESVLLLQQRKLSKKAMLSRPLGSLKKKRYCTDELTNVALLHLFLLSSIKVFCLLNREKKSTPPFWPILKIK